VTVFAGAATVVVVFAVLMEVLTGAYVVTWTLHSTFFGYFGLAFWPVPEFESALRSLARATRPPLFGKEPARSRLAAGLPPLIWMGVKPAGAGTLVTACKVVTVVSVTTSVKVIVGAISVVVVKIVLVSVKVS
jgi:hypothetical protein